MSTMTRQHFQLIADQFKSSIEHPQTVWGSNEPYTMDKHTVELLARLFATRLIKTNPNFDSARFLEACGVK